MPIGLSFFFNYGVILRVMLIIQLISGLLLAINYVPNEFLSFFYIHRQIYESNWRFILQSIHQYRASFFILIMLLHVGRGIYYNSGKTKSLVWVFRVIMLILSFGIAFFGYVLPFGQMSFWGATVITNLVSVVPLIGKSLVQWVWGRFLVNSSTLNRFFVLHFLLPFFIAILAVLHLFFVHSRGSTRKTLYAQKIPFHPFFVFKDLFLVLFILFFLFIFGFFFAYLVFDPENMMEANPLKTPPHIKPEWYFLFSYAILRSIPNKTLRVLALLSSLLLPAFIVFSNKLTKINLSFFSINFLFLTFLRGAKIEYPFLYFSQVFRLLYFIVLFFSIFS